MHAQAKVLRPYFQYDMLLDMLKPQNNIKYIIFGKKKG